MLLLVAVSVVSGALLAAANQIVPRPGTPADTVRTAAIVGCKMALSERNGAVTTFDVRVSLPAAAQDEALVIGRTLLPRQGTLSPLPHRYRCAFDPDSRRVVQLVVSPER